MTTCSKRTYPSPQAAHAALDEILRRARPSGGRRRRRGARIRDRVYKCRTCNGWHITRGEWGSLSDLDGAA